MAWKVIATSRYSKTHPDPRKRGKKFNLESQATYSTRADAARQISGSMKMDKLIGRRGVSYSVREVRTLNPGRAIHTAKFDRCVQSVKRRLKGVSNPYAVCMAAMGKKALRKRR